MKKLLIISLIGIVALTGCGDKTDDLENQNAKTNSQTTKLETKPIGSIIDGKNFLSLEYDEDKYVLERFGDEDWIYLTNKERRGKNYVAIKHMESKDIKTAADEYLKESKNDSNLAFPPKPTESDLDINSIKLINTYKNDDSSSVYFIDDNEGGSYCLSIQFGKKDDYFKNIKILSKEGNENLMPNIQLYPKVG